jgi:phosphatidate phosphatase APP1
VKVAFLGRTARTVSAHDGEFEAVIPAARGSPFPPGRHLAEVVAEGVRTWAAVQVVSPDAPFLLISDFDDTVAVTGVASIAGLLTSTFLQDAETQPAVPGMEALFRCLGRDGAPVAFVSGSPVQLAPRLARFLEKNGFSHAALYLRNLGRDTLSRYKEPILERLAERFPGLRLVLVGDTGERDPEIYAAFARAHPGRVLRAYLRQATPTPGLASRFEGQLLFQEPAQAARDAVARGLADPRCVEAAFAQP